MQYTLVTLKKSVALISLHTLNEEDDMDCGTENNDVLEPSTDDLYRFALHKASLHPEIRGEIVRILSKARKELWVILNWFPTRPCPPAGSGTSGTAFPER